MWVFSLQSCSCARCWTLAFNPFAVLININTDTTTNMITSINNFININTRINTNININTRTHIYIYTYVYIYIYIYSLSLSLSLSLCVCVYVCAPMQTLFSLLLFRQWYVYTRNICIARATYEAWPHDRTDKANGTCADTTTHTSTQMHTCICGNECVCVYIYT